MVYTMLNLMPKGKDVSNMLTNGDFFSNWCPFYEAQFHICIEFYEFTLSSPVSSNVHYLPLYRLSGSCVLLLWLPVYFVTCLQCFNHLTIYAICLIYGSVLGFPLPASLYAIRCTIYRIYSPISRAIFATN